MMFLYLRPGFRHRFDPTCVGQQSLIATHTVAKATESMSLCFSFPSSRSPPPSLPRHLSLSLSLTLSVSVSFSFQAWNHLIIAYSSFGRLLNAHLSKPGGNNLPWDITHTHTHMRAHTRAHTHTQAHALQGEDLLQQVHPQFTEIHHQFQIEEIFPGKKKKDDSQT